MKRELLFGATLLAMFGISGTILAQASHVCDAAPKVKGVYFASGDKWLPLQAINASATTSKGGLSFAKLAIPGGALFGMNPKSFLVFRDAAAPVSLPAGSTTVCLVGFVEINPRDIQLVRLTPKKDYRELAIVQGGISHYRESDLVRARALAESETHILVTITGNLSAGEYLLVVPRSGSLTPSGGYDFSVQNAIPQ